GALRPEPHAGLAEPAPRAAAPDRGLPDPDGDAVAGGTLAPGRLLEARRGRAVEAGRGDPRDHRRFSLETGKELFEAGRLVRRHLVAVLRLRVAAVANVGGERGNSF